MAADCSRDWGVNYCSNVAIQLHFISLLRMLLVSGMEQFVMQEASKEFALHNLTVVEVDGIFEQAVPLSLTL
jgi:hypothetical protein